MQAHGERPYVFISDPRPSNRIAYVSPSDISILEYRSTSSSSPPNQSQYRRRQPQQQYYPYPYQRHQQQQQQQQQPYNYYNHNEITSIAGSSSKLETIAHSPPLNFSLGAVAWCPDPQHEFLFAGSVASTGRIWLFHLDPSNSNNQPNNNNNNNNNNISKFVTKPANQRPPHKSFNSFSKSFQNNNYNSHHSSSTPSRRSRRRRMSNNTVPSDTDIIISDDGDNNVRDRSKKSSNHRRLPVFDFDRDQNTEEEDDDDEAEQYYYNDHDDDEKSISTTIEESEEEEEDDDEDEEEDDASINDDNDDQAMNNYHNKLSSTKFNTLRKHVNPGNDNYNANFSELEEDDEDDIVVFDDATSDEDNNIQDGLYYGAKGSTSKRHASRQSPAPSSAPNYHSLIHMDARSSRVINALAFDPAQPKILAAGLAKARDHGIYLWDINLHSNPLVCYAYSEYVPSLNFISKQAPSSSLLLAGLGNKTIRGFDYRMPSASNPQLTFQTTANHGITPDPFTPHQFASFSPTDPIVKVWDIRKPSYALCTFNTRDTYHYNNTNSPERHPHHPPPPSSNRLNPFSPATSSSPFQRHSTINRRSSIDRASSSISSIPSVTTTASASNTSSSSIRSEVGQVNSITFSPSTPGVLGIHHKNSSQVQLWHCVNANNTPYLLSQRTSPNFSHPLSSFAFAPPKSSPPKENNNNKSSHSHNYMHRIYGIFPSIPFPQYTHDLSSVSNKEIHVIDQAIARYGQNMTSPAQIEILGLDGPAQLSWLKNAAFAISLGTFDSLQLIGPLYDKQVKRSLQHDISTVMKRRLLVHGYGIDPTRNKHTSNDPQLKAFWSWIIHSENLTKDRKSQVDGFNFEFRGVRDILNGFLPVSTNEGNFGNRSASFHQLSDISSANAGGGPSNDGSRALLEELKDSLQKSKIKAAQDEEYSEAVDIFLYYQHVDKSNPDNKSSSSSSHVKPHQHHHNKHKTHSDIATLSIGDRDDDLTLSSSSSSSTRRPNSPSITRTASRTRTTPEVLTADGSVPSNTSGLRSYAKTTLSMASAQSVGDVKSSSSTSNVQPFMDSSSAKVGFGLNKASPFTATAHHRTKPTQSATSNSSSVNTATAATNTRLKITGGSEKYVSRRRAALLTLGPEFAQDDAKLVQGCADNNEIERATAWALWTDRTEDAISILRSSKDQDLMLLAPVLAGYLLQKNEEMLKQSFSSSTSTATPSFMTSTNENGFDTKTICESTQARRGVEYRELCSSLGSELEDPFLRAAFIYMSNGDWQDVLEEIGLPLRDRMAVAIKFLGDDQLFRFVDNTVTRVINGGELEGVVITGLGGSCGISLLQNYVDRTADTQTAALASSFPHDNIKDTSFQTNERRRYISRWADGYRELLDSWKLYAERVKFDQWKGKRVLNENSQDFVTKSSSTRINGGSSNPIKTNSAVGGALIRCGYCDGLSQGQLESTNMNASAPLNSSLSYTNNKALNKGMCRRCGQGLPRCSICLDRMEFGSGFSPSVWVWCQRCRHGGHPDHVSQWFDRSIVCPVAGCNCACRQSCC